MIEKFNKNAKVEKFTNMLGIAVRHIVIDPLLAPKGKWWVLYVVLKVYNLLLNLQWSSTTAQQQVRLG